MKHQTCGIYENYDTVAEQDWFCDNYVRFYEGLSVNVGDKKAVN